jgi:hypothetical protein
MGRLEIVAGMFDKRIQEHSIITAISARHSLSIYYML